MDKNYQPKDVEEPIYKMWEEGGYFKLSNNPTAKPFTILLPPPNANADLHVGHAMYVIEDIMIRYHRMLGEASLWLPGADHAGFETQFVYEKHLAKKGRAVSTLTARHSIKTFGISYTRIAQRWRTSCDAWAFPLIGAGIYSR